MASEMTNIEIRDFQTVSGVGEGDFVVLSLSGGSSAKMAVGMFTASVSSNATPSIKDGMWWIGSVNTDVTAEGKTPELRRGELGVEYKYTTDDDDAWKLLVPFEDIRINFNELTEEQRDQIRLKYTDLTEPEIAELQKPASDMISRLEETDANVQAAEKNREEVFAALKEQSESAIASANDTADHPTYIGNDHYVYRWNKDTQTYDKTDVYVKGDAFSIKKVYSSVDEMYADASSSFKEGDFCLINTGNVENVENAQLFVHNSSGGWDFLVDMSGAVGFTGKTPQFFIGTVSVGNGKGSAAVTLSSGGTDADGNPKYNINYIIPCLAYEDLSEEQIAELQRPASDMISQLQSTDDAVKEAEKLRVLAEEGRAEEFVRLKTESESATLNAVAATEEANLARNAADIAAQKADEAAERANVSADNADAATERADTAINNAQTAAEQANISKDSANAAAQAASGAAERADASAINADNATAVANEAAASAIEAASGANTAAEGANSATENARTAAEEANDAANNAKTSSASADVSANNANEAAENANTAAGEARNLPKIQGGTWWLWDVESGEYKDSGSSVSGRSPMIQNGTWWTWDDNLGEYTDTGQSVSAEYQLTKEKIEGVFTGDISTHTHTHLVYHAQIYTEQPDFSTLTSWTGKDGNKHEFVLGNDIYVADADEPTGYANYRFAYTSSGNAWVLVPQIPEGFKVVLVKKEQ